MRYCVVGNIIDQRIDKTGQVRCGTGAFSGGTKVYLCGRNRDPLCKDVGVIGLSRGKRWIFKLVQRECIVNLRVQMVFKPSVLKYLNDRELHECCWGSTKAEKRHAEQFVTAWNAASGDNIRS